MKTITSNNERNLVIPDITKENNNITSAVTRLRCVWCDGHNIVIDKTMGDDNNIATICLDCSHRSMFFNTRLNEKNEEDN